MRVVTLGEVMIRMMPPGWERLTKSLPGDPEKLLDCFARMPQPKVPPPQDALAVTRSSSVRVLDAGMARFRSLIVPANVTPSWVTEPLTNVAGAWTFETSSPMGTYRSAEPSC